MNLRDIAAADRAQILADPLGVGEDIVYMPFNGPAVPGRGVWIDSPSDERQGNGLGAEANTSLAILTISLALAPNLSRADQFQRVSTGVVWGIEQKPLTTGVGYRITLSLPSEANLRGIR